MKNLIKLWITVSAVAMATTISCYPPDRSSESGNKSLDNFANGGVKQYNSCTSNLQSQSAAKETSIIASSPQSKEAVLNGLAAVPQPFLRAFQAAGGRVLASKDAAKICGQVSQNNSEKDLNTGATIPSCWIQEKTGVAPQIILSDDPVLINHSIIRAFTYFFTEYFLTRVSHPDVIGQLPQSNLWPTGIQEFESHRDAVTTAFLRDLETKKSPASSALRAAYSKDPMKFKNSVLAEVLDSCYCSDRTRTILRVEFPATWSATQCLIQ
jgi:hypothetical protein